MSSSRPHTAPLIHTRTAGGIVLNTSGAVAMVRHSNGALWLFPKGHHEEGETDEAAARREIYEETGLSELEYLDDLGSYERHPILPNGQPDTSTMKEIRMFLFQASSTATLTPSFEIAEAKWVPLPHVAEAIGNPVDAAWFATVFSRVREAVVRD